MQDTSSSEDSFSRSFRERWKDDRSAGHDRGLRFYLSLWPDRQKDVATEYLRTLAGTERPSPGPHREPVVGDTLGPYLLEEEVGRGGQGVVYRARDVRLGRVVALKVLPGLPPGAEDQLVRFRREATVAAKLRHRGICQVHDVGLERDTPYIAMQLVSGKSLAQELAELRGADDGWDGWSNLEDDPHPQPAGAEEPALPVITRNQVHDLLRRVELAARALHAAHEAGVTHRDIKPGNIMTADDGEVVILDFGLARHEGDELPTLTQPGDMFGTPAYMSPEQIAAHHIRLDPRTDIYSLGVTLYECLTLRRPFDAPTREALYRAVLTQEPPDPRALNQAISKDLKVVLETALAKGRAQRYQTAAVFADELAAIRESRPVSARAIGPVGRLVRWASRRPAAAAVTAAIIIGLPLVAGLGGFIIANRPSIEAQHQERIRARVEEALERGFFQLHHGSADEALRWFVHATREDPTSVEALAGAALAHLKVQRPEDALKVIQDAESYLRDPDSLLSVKSDALHDLGRAKDAKETAARAPAPRGPLLWFIEGCRTLAKGERLGEHTPSGRVAFREANDFLSRAVAASPHARRAYWFQLAHATGHQGPRARPDVIVDMLLTLWPDSSSAHLWAGFASAYTDTETAVRCYREALRLRPTIFMVDNNLGNVLHRQGKLEEAVESYRGALRKDERDSYAWANLAVVLRALKRLDAALAAADRALEIEPRRAPVHHTRGLILKQQGRLDDAVAAYRRAIELQSDLTEARISLGSVLHVMGKGMEAVEALRSAVASDPDHASAHRNLGNALFGVREYDEAIRHLRRSIELDRTEARSHSVLGKTLAAKGLHELALASLRTGAELDPRNADVHFDLGLSHGALGDKSAAVASYERAIEIDPRHAETRCNLGLMLQTQGELRLAAEHLRRGHELGKERGTRWAYPSARWMESAVLTWVRQLAREGERDEAREILRDHIEAFPDIDGFKAALERLR